MKKGLFEEFIDLQDERFIILDSKFNHLGLSVFIRILSFLERQEDRLLHLEKIENISILLRVDTKDLEAVLTYCIEAGLLIQNDNVVYSQKLIDKKIKADTKSENCRNSVRARWETYKRNTNVIRTYDKEKERKEKKKSNIKEKEKRENKENIYSIGSTNINTKESSLNNIPTYIETQKDKKDFISTEYGMEPIELTLTLNDGREFSVTKKQMGLWKKNFNLVDVKQELNYAIQYMEPEQKNIELYIRRWLVREQKKQIELNGGKPLPTSKLKYIGEPTVDDCPF